MLSQWEQEIYISGLKKNGMDNLSKLKQRLEKQFGSQRVKIDYLLSSHTTLKIGGSADIFFEAENKEEFYQAVFLTYQHDLPVFILGGGSNILISDSGVRGLTILNRCRKIRISRVQGSFKSGSKQIQNVLVEVETGALINQLVRFTLDEGLAGLEHHLGLPGTVGGALFMNSKWTHPEIYIGDVLLSAQLVGRDGVIKTVPASYFDFGYDQSILQKTHEVVLSATFSLQKGDKDALWKTAHESLAYRTETQPKGVSTAGCTFRNIKQSDALSIPTPNHTKSAGYLIDQVGLKGYQVGGATISDKHANFILTTPGARARDVYAIIQEAQKRVKEKFNVALEPEVVLIGEFI